MINNSIMSVTSKTEQSTNMASFMSQLNIPSKKEDIYLTYDDLQQNNRKRHRRFTILFVMYSFISNLAFLGLVYMVKMSYIGQLPKCKCAFFAKTVILIFMNVFFIVFYILSLMSLLKNNLISSFYSFSSVGGIFTILTVQIALASMDYYIETTSCSNSIKNFINIFLLIEMFQFVGTLAFNTFYHYRVYQEIEMSVAFEEESEDGDAKEGRFNGSFALNLSRSEPSSKEKFRYKRKIRYRSGKKKKTEIEEPIMNVDLDKIAIVMDQEESKGDGFKAQNERVYKTPTKNLTYAFDEAEE